MKIDQISERSIGISQCCYKRKQFTIKIVQTILSVPESNDVSTSLSSPLFPKYNMIAALLSNFLVVERPCKCFWATVALPFIVVDNKSFICCVFGECYKTSLIRSQHWFRYCLMASTHYLSQCWRTSMLPYRVSWPHLVNGIWCRLPYVVQMVISSALSSSR